MCFITINLAFKIFNNIVKEIVWRKIKYVQYIFTMLLF